VLARANRGSLNVEGSYQHILTDLYAFIGTAIAAILIITSGFERADPIASVLVAGLMLRSAYGLLRDSGRVFLEAAPKGVDPNEIGRRMCELPGVLEVHDLHVWEVTSEFPALAAHVIVGSDADCHRARLELAGLLEGEFGIQHTTLQVEHEPDRLVQIE
jgi:cobalt-zinc-cadmium efflux system protein